MKEARLQSISTVIMTTNNDNGYHGNGFSNVLEYLCEVSMASDQGDHKIQGLHGY